MLHTTTEKFIQYLHIGFSPTSASSMHWYVVANEQARIDAALAHLTPPLEERLKRAQAQGKIPGFLIEEIDLAKNPKTPALEPRWGELEKIGVYVPIFRKADADKRNQTHRNIGQTFFDAWQPVVICLTPKGYENTTNPSKRETFQTLYLA